MEHLADIQDDLLNKAIEAFHRETGIQLRIKNEQIIIEGQKIDAVIQLPHCKDLFAVEIKRWAQQTNIGALVHHIQQLPLTGLLLADYVNPNMAKKLKENNVQFFDAVGNAYINQPPIYIHVTGNKQNHAVITAKDSNRAFDVTGLKVVFGFLCNAELVNATYREIANNTGVALGTVSWVINGLKDIGLLVDRGKGTQRRLINKRKLLDRWVEAYPAKLKPKQYVGEYVADDTQWWENIDIRQYNGYWGGEIAAAKYTEYLKPQVATLYLPKQTNNALLATAKLRKATQQTGNEKGLVKIYRPFWPETIKDEPLNPSGLAHPILVYADLIATGDTRNIETARIIYEQHIAEHIREN